MCYLSCICGSDNSDETWELKKTLRIVCPNSYILHEDQRYEGIFEGHTIGWQRIANSQIITTHGILLFYSLVFSATNWKFHDLSLQCLYL